MCICIAGLADVLTQIIISRNTNVALASKNEMKIKDLRGKSEILQREVERLIATSLKIICIWYT
jgi:ABC-type Fe3+-hydroxamate transport system substrate-binding protein